MRVEPGEEVLFRGHPSWLAMKAFLVRGLVLALLAGIVAGIASTVVHGRTQPAWVVAATVGWFALVFARGQRRRMRVTYLVTHRRVCVETRRRLRRRLDEAELVHVDAVTCRQSLLERISGTGTVHVHGTGLAFHGVEDPGRVVGTIDRALHRHRAESPVERDPPRAWPDAVVYR